MSGDAKDIEASGMLLVGREVVEREKRLDLVRKLLKLRENPRAVEMLKKCLDRKDEDPEVLKTVILGLGFVKDRSLVGTLTPFLEHPNMRVIAAAIKSLCRLDPNMEASALHPLLASKDEKARTAAVLALLSSNKRLGEEMIEQLATSPTESFRRTAAEMLDTCDPQVGERVRIEMFIRETTMDLIKSLARALKQKGISEAGLEKLNAFRAEIKAGKAAAEPDEQALRHAKIEILDRLCRRAYEKLDMSAGKIGELEGLVEKQAAQLATEKQDQARKADEQRRTDRNKVVTAQAAARRAGPPWRAIVAGFAVVAGLGAGVHFHGESQKNAVVLAKPVQQIDEPSVVGARGERITLYGEVLRVYPAQKAVAIKAPGVMVMAVFAQLPPEARDGAKVKLEGTIHAVRTKVSITVVGEKLVLSGG